MSILPIFPVSSAPKQPLPEAPSNKRRPCLKLEEESPHNSDNDLSNDVVPARGKSKKNYAKKTYPTALTNGTRSAMIAQCDRTEDQREECGNGLESMFASMDMKV
jgi:hypothetical protein